MKLSEKGKRKFLDNFYWFSEEFDQDDFEGMVCLTVEEAKALLRRIPDFKESGDWQLPIERLKERIEQAEGK